MSRRLLFSAPNASAGAKRAACISEALKSEAVRQRGCVSLAQAGAYPIESSAFLPTRTILKWPQSRPCAVLKTTGAPVTLRSAGRCESCVAYPWLSRADAREHKTAQRGVARVHRCGRVLGAGARWMRRRARGPTRSTNGKASFRPRAPDCAGKTQLRLPRNRAWRHMARSRRNGTAQTRVRAALLPRGRDAGTRAFAATAGFHH